MTKRQRFVVQINLESDPGWHEVGRQRARGAEAAKAAFIKKNPKYKGNNLRAIVAGELVKDKAPENIPPAVPAKPIKTPIVKPVPKPDNQEKINALTAEIREKTKVINQLNISLGIKTQELAELKAQLNAIVEGK